MERETNGFAVPNAQVVSCWGFLDDEGDACSVVTRRMEVIYLNAAARSLAPTKWFGCRCWEIFPVGEESCVARCPAVRAVSASAEVVYCEETIYAKNGSPVTLGVAVIPLEPTGKYGERAILLLRPKEGDMTEESFRQVLLERAEKLRASVPDFIRP